jgi:hypothetical protein
MRWVELTTICKIKPTALPFFPCGYYLVARVSNLHTAEMDLFITKGIHTYLISWRKIILEKQSCTSNQEVLTFHYHNHNSLLLVSILIQTNAVIKIIQPDQKLLEGDKIKNAHAGICPCVRTQACTHTHTKYLRPSTL